MKLPVTLVAVLLGLAAIACTHATARADGHGPQAAASGDRTTSTQAVTQRGDRALANAARNGDGAAQGEGGRPWEGAQAQPQTAGQFTSTVVPAAASDAVQRGRPTSDIVFPGPDGRLRYTPDERGNLIPDFSHAGYRGGGVALPNVPVRAVVIPEEGSKNDRKRIQAAIDTVSDMPLDRNGLRGAVLLKRGTYTVRGSLKLHTSGVVLRGEGQDEDGTVLHARGKKHGDFIVVQPTGRGARPPAVVDRTARITDDYVPVGARSFRVKSTARFAVGDTIAVVRPSTKAWIKAIGMDRIPRRKDGRRIKQWRPGSRDIAYYRTITAVEGDRITVNAPLFHALDLNFAKSFVVKHDLSRFLRNVGVENLRSISVTRGKPTDRGGDEDHPWTMVYMNYVMNAWVRNVTGVQFSLATVKTDQYTLNVTVQDSAYRRPVSRITGRRRFSFLLWGQLNLGLRLYSEFGRHDFVTGNEYSSGIVFLDSVSDRTFASSESHGRYATGVLYDSVRFRRPQADLVLGLYNRGNRGTGHGWTTANSVLWNCSAPTAGIAVEKPPLAQNYAIGCNSGTMTGKLEQNMENLTRTFAPDDAHWERWNAGPVAPRSLYLAQLRDRLGPDAVAAVTRLLD